MSNYKLSLDTIAHKLFHKDFQDLIIPEKIKVLDEQDKLVEVIFNEHIITEVK